MVVLLNFQKHKFFHRLPRLKKTQYLIVTTSPIHIFARQSPGSAAIINSIFPDKQSPLISEALPFGSIKSSSLWRAWTIHTIPHFKGFLHKWRFRNHKVTVLLQEIQFICSRIHWSIVEAQSSASALRPLKINAKYQPNFRSRNQLLSSNSLEWYTLLVRPRRSSLATDHTKVSNRIQLRVVLVPLIAPNFLETKHER